MKSLFIDTSMNRIIVAVTANNTVLSSYNEECHRDFSAQVMSIIDKQLNKAKLTINDVDTVFVIAGPGSFTGVRIGITIAKTIGWALNKRVIPLSSLELLATTDTNTEYRVSYIDARRGYVYAGLYDWNLKPVMTDRYILKTDLIKITDKYEVVGISYDNFIDNFSNITPNINILKVIDKHKDDIGINPHLLKPNYLKNTEAEETIKSGT